MSVATLVEEFRQNSLRAAELHARGKVRAGNRRADASHRAYVELAATQEGRRALLTLLEDPERVVQIDVAGRLLPDPAAKEALERWAQGDDDRGWQARFTLKYWRPS